MFGIIILHETGIGQFLSEEQDQHSFQDAGEEIGIHDAFKDTNLCGTMSAHPGPNMNFQQMLRSALVLH